MSNNTVDAFTSQYTPVAEVVGKQLGVAPAVLLSQWGLETGWGKSIVPGTNNLGNIKDFSGAGTSAKDNMTGSSDKYRKYDTPEHFGAEYASLIQRKYPAAIGTGADPVAFASALKAGGYAEDPNYVASVTNTYNSMTGEKHDAGSPVAAPAPEVFRPRATPETADASFKQRTGGVPAAAPATERDSWLNYPDTVLPGRTDKGASGEHLSQMEKLAIHQEEALAARAGMTIEQIAEVRTQAKAVAPTLVEQIKQTDSADLNVDETLGAGIEKLANRSKENVLQREREDDVTWKEKYAASNTRSGTWDVIKRHYERANAPIDKQFVWADGWQDKLDGYQADEQELLMESQSNGPSSKAWDAVKGQIADRRQADKELRGGSQFQTVTAGIVSGATDVPAYLAFMGVGKTLQLAGVGARALAAAGRPVAAVVASGGEAVAGGLLLEGTLAAAGEHRTVNDMVTATGINLGLGLALGLLHVRPAVAAEEESIVRAAVIANAEREEALWVQAQQNVGEGASTVALKAEVDRMQVEAAEQFHRIALSGVPEDRRMLPANLAEQAPRAPEVLKAAEERLGVQNIADDAERALALAYYESAERILNNTTIDLSRVSQFTKAAGMESTSQAMLTSKNPLMQAIGVTLVESGAGIGGRGQTAALSRHLNYRQFVGDFNTKYEQAYHLWSRENGGSFMGDRFNGDHYRRFNRMVAEAIEDQAAGKGPVRELHVAVAQAVKLQRDGMDFMRKAMQKVGTTGAARLGDTSTAYMTRSLSAEKVRSLSNPQKQAIVSILRDQFMDLNGYDKAFATEHAKKYLDIANTRAMGSVEMPLSIHDERAAGIVADSLKAMGVDGPAIKDLMGKYSRGGANFTKGRADLSLNTVYNIGGEEFRLMDLIETDVPMLFRRYAARAAGEVALTQFGVQGRAGLEQLRVALAHGPARVSEKEMQAFDQIAAEFLGNPFGNRVRLVDNATSITSTLRLGGMGITQSAESLNGIGALGVARTLASIAGMPRLLREATQQIKSGVPKNKIIGSIEVIGGEIGLDHYRTAIPFAQTDVIAKQAGMETYSTTDRIIKSGQNVQAKLSMHRAILTGQVRGMSEQIVHKAVRFIRDGGNDAALKDMGFTDDVLAALKKDLPKMAKFKGDKLVDFDLTKATDLQAANSFVQAVHRGSAQIIQGTFIGETGKWAHSSWLKMLTQFRSFSLTAVEKQWNRQAGVHGAATALGFMVAAMSVAIPIQAARVYAASVGMSRSKAEEYREKQLSPLALARASMNYISTLGLAPDFFDALSIPLGMEADDARGLSTGLGRIIPAVGAVDDVLKAGKVAATWSPLSKRESVNPADAFKKLTPFGRLPYLIPLVNSLGAD